MKGIARIGIFLGFTLGLTLSAEAARPPGYQSQNTDDGMQNRAAGCVPATALTKLNYNNVSALLENGGSMWQDRAQGVAAYEVPKGSGLRVLFSGCLWIGGLDFNDQLKICALQFRQGNDFWPGPLSTDGAADVSSETCKKYDRFYPTLKQDIATFKAYIETGELPYPGYVVPESILNWPGNNYDFAFGQEGWILAPFKDLNNNLVYEPDQGDYPWYDIEKEEQCGTERTVTLYGDANYWWVFNDKGNIHTETGGDPIGMEIRAQAFAFSTNDEVNDMTFYNYEVINRGTQTLYETYFGQWADPDIGGPYDDYIGCDVQRGFGYAYNGDANDQNDGSANGYGSFPAAVGIDFFQGPYQDSDGLDNPLTTNVFDAIDSAGIPYAGIGIGYGDSVIDNERFGMRRFVYFTSTAPQSQSDPDVAIHYYQYLTGRWKDVTPFYYGGTGHTSSPGVSANGFVESDYMFFNDSDPLSWATHGTVVPNNWTEATAGNQASDRRFVQSAGPFILLPGQKNNVTVGVVYARATSGGPFASVIKLRVADDKAQALFDNCFKILDGPHAPEVTIQELDRAVVVYLTNPVNSNNYKETYEEKDPFITLPEYIDLGDTLELTSSYSAAIQDSLKHYYFQGYKIYQLANSTVSSSDLQDVDKARLVAQVDVKDGVSRLVNFEKDEDLGYDIPTLKVDGTDEGIKHSFHFTTDAFTGARLINHKSYYYMAIAYAYNNYKTFDPNDGLMLDGQKKPYLESRQSPIGKIESHAAIPHIPVPETNGLIQNAEYGDGFQLTRIEGAGSSNNWLEFTYETEMNIVANSKMAYPTYKAGNGPVDVKVVDPLNVIAGEFKIAFLPDTVSGGFYDVTTTITAGQDIKPSYWALIADSDVLIGEEFFQSGDTILVSDQIISIGDEQIIPDLGISVSVNQFKMSNEVFGIYTCAVAESLGWELEYADSSKRWLSGVSDVDGYDAFNWIRIGNVSDESGQPALAAFNDIGGFEDDSYEQLVNGTWAPALSVAVQDNPNDYVFCAPMTTEFDQDVADFGDWLVVRNVDIVFTADKSLWTRCPVLEMQDDPALAQGNQTKLYPRDAPSIDKNGIPTGQPGCNEGEAQLISATGMGWFPGYAIDLETGERMNMAYSEDSWLAIENGRDMMFNPTNRLTDNFGNPMFGGKHYVYVYANKEREVSGRMPVYDQGAYFMAAYASGSSAQRSRVWQSCAWIGMPMLASDFSFSNPKDIPTTARVKLRVKKPLYRYSSGYTALNDPTGALNNWRPLYSFNTAENATGKYETEARKDSILALIDVVPNPYYAYSTYETGRLDTRVKIVNLPQTATIRIFNTSGQLVRYYTKDSEITSVDWDLKNQAGIPIASGVYIIHVEVPDMGEVVLKWFGGLRPPDLESF